MDTTQHLSNDIIESILDGTLCSNLMLECDEKYRGVLSMHMTDTVAVCLILNSTPGITQEMVLSIMKRLAEVTESLSAAIVSRKQ